MKFQLHNPHLVEIHMCNLLESNLHEVWVCGSDLILYA